MSSGGRRPTRLKVTPVSAIVIRRMALPRDILDIQTIYMEPAVETYDRGRQVLAYYPNARRIMVPHITKSRLFTATKVTLKTGCASNNIPWYSASRRA